MDLDLVILSPEKTILTYRVAGLGPRIWAHLADLLLIVASLVGITFLIIFIDSRIGAFSGTFDSLMSPILSVLIIIGPFAYFALFEGIWNGLTPGKKITGIRVRMADGTPITFPAALGRNLLRPADMLPGPYLLGFIVMFTNPRSQRLGDIVANTVVIHEKRTPTPFNIAPHTAGIHPMEAQVGELVGMTLEEYAALRRLCDRYPELPPNVQARLLEEVWAPIATLRKVPKVPDVHPIYLAEAMVMKYGRTRGLL